VHVAHILALVTINWHRICIQSAARE